MSKMATDSKDYPQSDPDYAYDQAGDKEPVPPPYTTTHAPAPAPAPALGPYPMQPMQPTQQQQQSNTTVVVNQPQPQQRVKAPRTWSSGVCNCFDDMGVCLCGWCVPCCLMHEISTDMGESCCVPCCVPGASIVLRGIWRTRENIQGSVMDDCCLMTCCPLCSICQLKRDINLVKRTTNMAPIVYA